MDPGFLTDFVRIRVPVGQKFAFLHIVQTGSEMGTGGSVPGGKAAGA
jgi:hypothetical protein